jgi:hypothetical protein
MDSPNNQRLKTPPRPVNNVSPTVHAPTVLPESNGDTLKGNALDCSLIPTATVQSLASTPPAMSTQEKGKMKGFLGNMVAGVQGIFILF